MWHLMMVANIVELCLIVILIVCVVSYAREGARNAGKLEVHERIFQEGKTLSIERRK